MNTNSGVVNLVTLTKGRGQTFPFKVTQKSNVRVNVAAATDVGHTVRISCKGQVAEGQAKLCELKMTLDPGTYNFSVTCLTGTIPANIIVYQTPTVSARLLAWLARMGL